MKRERKKMSILRMQILFLLCPCAAWSPCAAVCGELWITSSLTLFIIISCYLFFLPLLIILPPLHRTL